MLIPLVSLSPSAGMRLLSKLKIRVEKEAPYLSVCTSQDWDIQLIRLEELRSYEEFEDVIEWNGMRTLLFLYKGYPGSTMNTVLCGGSL